MEEQVITETGIERLKIAIRLARARAPQGLGADVATILSIAHEVFPGISLPQSNQLFEAFVKRPKADITKTLMLLHPTERDKQLLCPILVQLAKCIDGVFSGSNWERSCVVYSGSLAESSFARLIAQLRIERPGEHIPNELQRVSSVLGRYKEVYTVFENQSFVTTIDISKYFRGELTLGTVQTDYEKAGPEVWIVLCKVMGYPEKAYAAYDGTFHTDHICERSLYTGSSRNVGTIADTLSNYGMLFCFFNQHANLKQCGMEKNGWWTTDMVAMARLSLQFRCDYSAAHDGDIPTLRQWIESPNCKDAWKPSVLILGNKHPLNKRGGKRGIADFFDPQQQQHPTKRTKTPGSIHSVAEASTTVVGDSRVKELELKLTAAEAREKQLVTKLASYPPQELSKELSTRIKRLSKSSLVSVLGSETSGDMTKFVVPDPVDKFTTAMAKHAKTHDIELFEQAFVTTRGTRYGLRRGWYVLPLQNNHNSFGDGDFSADASIHLSTLIQTASLEMSTAQREGENGNADSKIYKMTTKVDPFGEKVFENAHKYVIVSERLLRYVYNMAKRQVDGSPMQNIAPETETMIHKSIRSYLMTDPSEADEHLKAPIRALVKHEGGVFSNGTFIVFDKETTQNVTVAWSENGYELSELVSHTVEPHKTGGQGSTAIVDLLRRVAIRLNTIAKEEFESITKASKVLYTTTGYEEDDGEVTTTWCGLSDANGLTQQYTSRAIIENKCRLQPYCIKEHWFLTIALRPSLGSASRY